MGDLKNDISTTPDSCRANPPPVRGPPQGAAEQKFKKSTNVRTYFCPRTTTWFFKGRRRKKRKKSDVPTYLPFLRFFAIFRFNFRKYFYGVFRLLMQRNGQKRDKTNRWQKTTGKKFFVLNFFGQKFLTWIFPKSFLWCF
jgi:hypothetical protein